MSKTNGDHRFRFFRRGVQQTLDNAGARKLSALQTIKAAVAKEEQRLVAERPKVYLAMPAYSRTGTHDGAWTGFMLAPTDKENLTVAQSKFTNSLLTRSFNHLWAQAIAQRNQGNITHFAMLHTDIAPEQFWLDKLWEEMYRTKADLVSVVSPIKSLLGVTSVAVDDPDDPWQPRRLTMTEIIEKLPETFGCTDVEEAGLNPKGGLLLHNTGCWLCDLRRPWVDATDEAGNLRCYFTIKDCIRKMANGSYFVGVQPEDWTFSRMVQTVDPNAKLLSTRKVSLEHMGETGYPNNRAWGQWETDEETNVPLDTSEEEAIPEPEPTKEPEPLPA